MRLCKIAGSKILLFLLLFLAGGLLFSGRACQVKAEDSTEEALDFLKQTDPEQYINLNGLNITEEQYEEIKAKTLEVIADASTTEEKLQAIYKYAYANNNNPQNTDYVLQAGESVNDPYPMFCLKKGVCQGYAQLIHTMCTAAGIPSVVVSGYYIYNDGSTGGHAWTLVWCNDQWGILDGSMCCMNVTNPEVLWPHYQLHRVEYVMLEENNYQITYYGGVAVVGYTGDEEELVIPETCLDGKYKITAINCGNNSQMMEVDNLLDHENVKKLVIPATVTSIQDIDTISTGNLEQIIVDENNPTYYSYSGALYSREGDQLLYVPMGIQVLELKQQGVIEKGTISYRENLQVLKFAEGTTALELYAVEECPNLRSVYLPDSVTTMEHQDEDLSNYISEAGAFDRCGTNFTIYASEDSVAAAYAKANGLTTKDPKKEAAADYSELEEIQKSLPSDLGKYTEESVQAYENAKSLVVYDLASGDQSSVDQMIAAVETARKGLTLKEGETEETEPEETEKAQQTEKASETEKVTETEKTTASAVSLKKVTNLKVKYKGKQKIVLSWKKVSQADGYEIYRYQNKKWVKVKKVSGKTSVTITKGSVKKYQYKVRAYKKVGKKLCYGDFSKIIKVKKK